MAVHTLINQLSTEALDALIKDISSKIIKDPELDPKAVSKSLAVLKALIVLNKTFDFNTLNLIIDSKEKAFVQTLISDYFGASCQHVYVSNHPSDALGVALAIALENDAQTIVLVDDVILNYGKTFESLIQIARTNPNLVVIFFDATDNLVKPQNLKDAVVKNMRLSPAYSKTKLDLKHALSNPIGKPILSTLSKVRDGLKGVMLEETIFSQFNFNYHGMIQGENLKELTKSFNQVKHMHGANLVHLQTKNRTLQKLKLPSFKTESDVPEDYVHYKDVMDQIISEYDDITLVLEVNHDHDHFNIFKSKHPDHYYVSSGTYHSMVDFIKGLVMLNKKIVFVIKSFQFKHIASLVAEQLTASSNVLFIIKDAGLNDAGDLIKQGVYDVSLASLMGPRMFMGRNLNEAQVILKSILTQDSFQFTILRIPDKMEKRTEIELFDMAPWEVIHQPTDSMAYVIGYGPSISNVRHKVISNDLSIGVINAREIFNLDTKLLSEIAAKNIPVYIYDLEDMHHTLYKVIKMMIPNLILYNISLQGTDLSLRSRDLKLRYRLNTDHLLNIIIKK